MKEASKRSTNKEESLEGVPGRFTSSSGSLPKKVLFESIIPKQRLKNKTENLCGDSKHRGLGISDKWGESF